MHTTFRTGAAGLALALAAAAPAPAATVTVRVEGASSTLVRQVKVSPSNAVTVDKTATGGTTCQGNTYGGALELATGGDWTGPSFQGLGQSISTIKGERHTFGTGAFWALDVNNAPTSFGLCATANRPAQGDEVLFYAACDGPPAPGCFSGDPLDVTGPATAAPGEPFSVRVDEFTSPFGATPTRA